jgi:hypothetical protein
MEIGRALSHSCLFFDLGILEVLVSCKDRYWYLSMYGTLQFMGIQPLQLGWWAINGGLMPSVEASQTGMAGGPRGRAMAMVCFVHCYRRGKNKSPCDH